MKWIIIFSIVAFICFVWMLVNAIKDAQIEPSAGTVIRYPEEDNEFSPKNSISDETIKRVVLRNKLNKIEEEKEKEEGLLILPEDWLQTRIDDINLDYSREDGK
jgi:hypothetical protein